jgi:putative ABC transport system ATP-binding protein
MPKKVIEVDNLVKKFNGRKPILDGVSFSVGEKEFVTVCGKSGCGKTTLLNILGGLDRPTSGRVAIDGVDITDLGEDDLARLRLQKIGFVFQDYNLLMDLTVRENIALPLRFSKGRDTGVVDRLLEKFEISHIAGETANKISGGEAQRAAIARALVNTPRIILADEPTGNLDSENTRIVIETLQLVIKDFETTVVLATHDNDLAAFSSMRIEIVDGRVSLEGLAG